MLGTTGSPKDIANFLQCFSFLEKQKSNLYNILSEKVTLANFNACFLKLSQDTKKSSQSLEQIANQISNSKIGDKECSRRLANAYSPIEHALKIVNNKEEFSDKELSDLLCDLDCTFGDESYVVIQAHTFLALASQMSDLYGVHLEDFRKVFYDILEDEQFHLDLLKIIKAILNKRIHDGEGSSPVVRFRNPDAWIASAVC